MERLAMIDEIESWFLSLFEKLLEDPLKNFLIIVVSLIIIQAMIKELLKIGYLPTISYIVACTYGFTKIVDNPSRPLMWAVGFILGNEVSKLFFNAFIPTLLEKTQVSIFSALIILYVIISFKIHSNRLKKY